MERYKLVEEIHEFNSEIKRIYELMGLTFNTQQIMEVNGTVLAKVRPALE